MSENNNNLIFNLTHIGTIMYYVYYLLGSTKSLRYAAICNM